MNRATRRTVPAFCVFLYAAAALLPACARDFRSTDRLVALSVFHWYTSTEGQTQGVWHPLEGRAAWDGTPAFWRRQVKDMMDANADLLFIHLIDRFDEQRFHLFQALGELRREGYRIPALAPFFDPAITFYGPPDHQPPVDLSLPADRERFLAEYVRFYREYQSANPDADAWEPIATLNGRPMLNTWAVGPHRVLNKDVLTRDDLESYLARELGGPFKNGVFMITLIPQDGFVWADAFNRAFVGYTGDYVLFDGICAAIKPGQWDTLDRFLARNGGAGYTEAWERILAHPEVRLAIVESWNEYTEGTGIYEATPSANLSEPGYRPHEDTWGPSPRTYIDLTAAAAAQFNMHPPRDAAFTRFTIPDRLPPGATGELQVRVLNLGDSEWSAAAGYALAPANATAERFGIAPAPVDDASHEVPRYGGVFRGRPVDFVLSATAPLVPGRYELALQMRHAATGAFGPRLVHPVLVGEAPHFESE